MTDYRIMTTDDLTALNRRARSLGLSRKLPQELIDVLDPKGIHVAGLVLFGHNSDAPGKLHHRTRVLAKVTDTDEPSEGFLDMRAEDWNRLTTPEAALAEIEGEDS